MTAAATTLAQSQATPRQPEYRAIYRDGLWRVLWRGVIGSEHDVEVLVTSSAAEAYEYVNRAAELERRAS